MAESFLSTKRIPTLLGIVILAAGLIGGIFLANSVTTGFLPRASPETTPKSLKITNITDTSFTISWVTDSKTTGYIKYGPSANAISTVITDDRDQISGSVGQYRTHHVTVRGLTASTTYFYKIGTGTTELYDDSGKPYQTKTTSPITSSAKTLYGQVSLSNSTAANGALIYITGDQMAPLSGITQSTGSFALSLGTARAKDGVSPAPLTDDTKISLLIVSPTDDTTSVIDATIVQGQPFPDIVLGQNQNLLSPTETPQPQSENTAEPTQSKFTSQLLSPPVESSASANLLTITTPTSQFVFSSPRPKMSGSAAKSVTVSISIAGPTTLNSSTKSTTAGAWSYTPSSNLKNGSYTLTASTTVSGKKETQSVSFAILVPTPTPKSSTASAVLGSTESADLVSGSTELTLTFALAGALFIGSGVAFAVSQSSDSKKRKRAS